MEAPSFIVLITGVRKDGSTFHGTGFAVSSDGLIATCRHVVCDYRPDQLFVHFPYSKPRPYVLRNENKRDDLALIAGLVPASPRIQPAMLNKQGFEESPGSKGIAFGFSAMDHYSAPQRIECVITAYSSEHGRIGLNGDINPGDSGGPILGANGSVFGIAQAKDGNRSGQAMAIPVQRLIELLSTADHDDLAKGNAVELSISELNLNDLIIVGQSILDEITRNQSVSNKITIQLSKGVLTEAQLNPSAINVPGRIRSLFSTLEVIEAHESAICRFRDLTQGPLGAGIDYPRQIRLQESDRDNVVRQQLIPILELLVTRLNKVHTHNGT